LLQFAVNFERDLIAIRTRHASQIQLLDKNCGTGWNKLHAGASSDMPWAIHRPDLRTQRPLRPRQAVGAHNPINQVYSQLVGFAPRKHERQASAISPKIQKYRLPTFMCLFGSIRPTLPRGVRFSTFQIGCGVNRQS